MLLKLKYKGLELRVLKDVVLFDLDGTLVNSLNDLCDSANYMLDKLGFPRRSLDEVRCFVGNGIDMLVRRAVGNNEFDFDKAMKYYREYYNKNLCNKTRPYEGIERAVAVLRENGFKLGVVTNKAQWAAEKIVKYYFNDSFDAIAGADLSKRKKKPHSDAVDLALEIIGAERKSAVFVGDSEVDIATAENIGMDFIGVAWGFRNEEIFAHVKHFVRTSEQLVSLCCNFK